MQLAAMMASFSRNLRRCGSYSLPLILAVSTLSAVTAPIASAATVTATGTNPSTCDQVVGNSANVSASRVGNNCVVEFKSGSTTWRAPVGVSSVQVMVVAGGGSGGGTDWTGGGGAGGVITASAYSVTGSTDYSVVVGAGGASQSNQFSTGNAGSDSSFDGKTAKGGGGGAGYGWNNAYTATGGDGGSGGGSAEDGSGSAPASIPTGGASTQTLPSGFDNKYGNKGGDSNSLNGQQAGGGGGGAGAAGGNVTGFRLPGNGGAGVSLTLGGKTFNVAAGGGGASAGTNGVGGSAGGVKIGGDGARSDTSITSPVAGTVNTGSGGGGTMSGVSTSSGAGGSGIVVVAYAMTTAGAPTALTATVVGTQASLSWTAPTSNGGSAITDYLIEYSLDGTNFTTFADGTSTSTSATVTGLISGTAYRFRVSTVNAIGTGTSTTTNLNDCNVTTTSSGGYTYIAFKNLGICNWNIPAGVSSVDYLVVAGGGGGGTRHAGGGGAGGLLQGSSSLTSVTSLSVTVGDGGAGGDTAVSGQNYAYGSPGNNSTLAKNTGSGSFTTQSAVGGGQGNTGCCLAGGTGGSGGGALGSGGTATAGQGNAGGAGYTNTTSYWGSGGGGGAGAVGATASLNQAGNGGIGTTWVSSFTTAIATSLSLANTSNVYFAGGGGGGATAGTAGTGGSGGGGNGNAGVNTDASAGIANTGGGGGGGGLGTSVPKGGKGGSGVVLLRYLNAPSISLSTSTISATVSAALTSYSISNSGGAAASYSISPSLSDSGLSFSTSTGLISGTPTANASATTYTITATNTSGTSSTTFSLNVTTSSCSPMSVSSGGYTILTFASASTCNWSVPVGITKADVLVVGGGGGGAGNNANSAGTLTSGAGAGGGGGAYLASAVSVSDSVTIVVGAGGAGGTFSSGSTGNSGQRGATSSFGTLTAGGGGAGGCENSVANGVVCPSSKMDGANGTAGGGGGGATNYWNAYNWGAGGTGSSVTIGGTTYSGQNGFRGGYYNDGGTSGSGTAGPGGGARSAGTFNTPGSGLSSTISGSTVEYGKGGSTYGVSGWSFRSSTSGYGTGGDGAYNTAAGLNGAAGAQGIVIVKYINPPSISLSTSTISANVGSAVTSYTISNSSGAADSYSISPSLAVSGLSFSTSNGQISGTPTATASSTTYTITATNTSGTSTATFSLSSAYATCSPTSAVANGYTVLTFTSLGSCNWTVPTGVTTSDVLVVGGGGGAGHNSGGGGSGGGVYYQTAVPISGVTTVTVGAGGAAGTSSGNGSNGGQSVFGSTSVNGGNGGTGSTGGAGGASVAGTGLASGSGAGGKGSTGTNVAGIQGSDGPSISITGTATNYAGGGAGGGWLSTRGNAIGGAGGGGAGGGSSGNAGTAGTANTGGGGGASSVSTATSGAGGSGLVVVRYVSTYTITYSYESATAGNSTPSATFSPGGSAITLPTPTRNGYTLSGWHTATSGGSLVGTAGASYSPTGSTAAITIFAVWTANSNTVIFNNNTGSGTMSNQSITSGVATALTANTFTKTGYTFAGWNTNADGTTGTSYTDSQTVTLTAGMTLYAKWTANTNTVVFNNNTGTGTMANQSITTAVSTALTSNTFTKTGYTFAGWNTNADGVSGTSYTNAQAVTLTAGMTLYAKWTGNSQTITYAAGTGGTGSAPTTPTSVAYGSTFTAPANTYTRSGYTFAGWNDGTNTYAASATYPSTGSVSGNVTLTATWTANTNTVTFDSQGGSAVSSLSWTTATSLTLPAAPTRAGYIFDGWYDTATAGSRVVKNALSFDGVNDRVIIPHSASFNFSTGMTIEAWVNTTATRTEYITTKGDDSFYVVLDLGRLAIWVNGVTTGWFYSTTTVNDGNWHHIAATYNGTVLKGYIDGVEKISYTKTATISSGTASVEIGSRTNSVGTAYSYNYSGKIYDVRYWNVARSAVEISGAMNSELTGSESGLVAAYLLNQGSPSGNNAGRTAVTSSKSGSDNGTLSGFALSGSSSNWVSRSTSYSPANTAGFTLYAQWVGLSADATLSALSLSSGTLSPSFVSSTTSYTASVANSVSTGFTVTPTVTQAGATTVQYLGATGTTSFTGALSVGANVIRTVVTAQDGSTISTYTVTVTRLATQTITFGSLTNKTLGSGTYSISATASSSLTVAFTSATTSVCTVSGTTVTLVSAGTCTINADQAGDASYAAATQVQRSFTVAAGLSITTPSGTALQGTYNTAFTSLTISSSGGAGTNNFAATGSLPAGVTLSSAGVISGTPSTAGDFSLTVTVTDANGATATTSSFTISIAKGVSTVSISGPSYTYTGSAQGPDSVTKSGSSGTVSYAYAGRGSTTYASSSTKPTNVGTYTVTATVAADTNFASVSASANFEILAASLIITPTISASSMPYGTVTGSLPTISYSKSAVVTLTTNPTCALYLATDTGYVTVKTLSSTLAVGSYVVNCKNAALANYTITYGADAAFSVTKLDIAQPNAPNVSATAGVLKSIAVSWTAASNATSYNVKMYAADGVTLLATISVSSGTTKTVTSSDYSSIADGTNYKFSVIAVGDATYADSLASALSSAVTTNSSYTITYNYNGADGAASTISDSFITGATAITLPVPTKTGYTFAGWFEASGLTGSALATTYSPTQTRTVYAKWSANSLTVTYDSQGGSSVTAGSANTGSSISSAPTAPTRAGYTLSGWATTSSGSVITFPYAHGQTANFTLYAIWAANSLTVTYDSQGGSAVSSGSANTGASISAAPTAPTKAGYTLSGWSATSTGSVITFPYTHGQTASFTLYAIWAANALTVTYDSQGGSAVSSGSVNTGASISAAPTAPTRSGYTFGGWSTTSTGSVITFPYAHGQTTGFTLYAKWTANGNTVVFNNNTGSGTMADQSIMTAVATALNANTFTKTGYSFAGWNTNADGTSGTSYTDSQTVTLSAGMTVYAKWSANTYTVTYNYNGATADSATATSSFTTGGTVITLPTPTKTGYTFGGWYSDSGLTTSIGAAGASYSPTTSLTAYAKWTANSNTVTFNANDGSGTPATSTQSITSGTPTALTGNTFTRTGYTFTGWTAAANGTGTSYTDSQTVTLTGGMTIYAKWTANVYTITYAAGTGGSGSAPSTPTTATFGTTFTAPANTFTKTGFTFAGWNDSSATYAAAATYPATGTVSGNVTLTATWTGNICSPTSSTSGGYTRYTFTSTTTCFWDVPVGVSTVDILAVAGGSGGGYSWDNTGAGGGAGGQVITTSTTLSGTVTVSVGQGGAGGTTSSRRGGSGTDSSIGSVTALAGTGGCAGRSACSVTSQATALAAANGGAGGIGGASGKGGGGSSTVALAPTSTVGGTGTSSNYSGSSLTYGTGGAGGAPQAFGSNIAGSSASANTGNGGGGASAKSSSGDVNGGAGGSGLIIVRVANANTVAFDANTGTGTMTDQSITSGTATTLTSNSFTKTGYTFAGWNTNADGTSGTSYTNGQSVTITAGMTLFAKWTLNTYAIAFNANNGSGSMGNQSITHGVAVGLSANLFTRANYVFYRWATAANGSGSTYSDLAQVTLTAGTTLYAQWTPNTYVVTYNYDSATAGSSTTTASFTTAGTAITLPTPTKTGYTFAGWFSDAALTSSIGLAGASYSPTGTTLSLNAYAKWTAINYTFTYDANSADTGSVPTETSKQISQTATIKANTGSLVRAGYTFSGWNTASDGTGTNYLSGSQFTVQSSNVTLYAKWSANTYTVTYNVNGGTGSAQRSSNNVTSDSYTTGGTSIALPGVGTLERSGYTFGGWNTSAAGTGTNRIEGDLYTTVSDVTFYAKWIAVTYSITYNGNTSDGGTTPTTGGYTTGQSSPYAVASNTFTKTSNIFGGWNTASNGTGTNYSPGATITTLTNITLYAVWIPQYTLHYAVNGGTVSSGSLPSDTLYSTGTSVGPVFSSLSRTGYTFAGWTNGLATIAPNGNFTILADSVLTAKWTPINYVISYNSDGGSDAPAGETKQIGQSYTVGSAVIKPGYNFAGWWNGSSVIGADAVIVMGSSNVTYTAQWTAKVYRVSYDWNGGRGTAVSDVSYTYGTSAITLPLVGDRIKDGYTFAGWSESTSGSLLSATYTPSQSRTLYALWNIGNFTITYDAGRGTVANSSVAVLNGGSTTLPLPTRTNFVFSGWHTASTGGSSLGSNGTSFTPTSSQTVYARWIQSSLYGITDSLSRIGSVVTADNVANTFSGANSNSSVSVSVPANAFVAGTTINFDLVGNSSRAVGVLPNVNYLISIAVSWLTGDETVPETASGKPISVTISNATIKAGASAYAIINNVSTLLGTATQDGTITVSITSDPEIVVAATKPTAPTNVSATSNGAQQSVISWSAPTSNGGSAITGYTVTANTGATCTTSSTSCTISSLTNGTTYTFTVIATNAVGTSDASSSTSATTASLYSVAFNAKGGTTVSNGSFLTASTVSEPTAPTRTGYAFAGWSATDGGSAEYFPYAPGVTTNITMYARWDALDNVVTFDSKGGTSVADDLFPSGGTLAAPTAPTRSGYTFAGWSATDGGSAVAFPYAPGVVTDITLYAKWSVASSGSSSASTSGGSSGGQNVFVSAPVTVVGSNKDERGTSTVALPAIQGEVSLAKLKVDKVSDKYIADAKIVDSKIVLTPEKGFSGKKMVTVTILTSGNEQTIQIPLTVLPEVVTKPVVEPVAAKKSVIKWVASPNANSYKVFVNGKQVCTSTATSCIVKDVLGPNSAVEIISNGGDRTASEKIPAEMRQTNPVVINRIFSANIKSGELSTKDAAALNKVASVIKSQGFGTVVISKIVTTSKSSKIAAARIEAIKSYLQEKAGDAILNFEVVPSRTKTYFNNIALK